MSEPGTPTGHDPQTGDPLNKDWWDGVAREVLEKTLSYGAGDGADQDIVSKMSAGLQVAFGNNVDGDMGEGRVRKLLGSSSSTDVLKDELIILLLSRTGAAMQARLAQQTGDNFHDSDPSRTSAAGGNTSNSESSASAAAPNAKLSPNTPAAALRSKVAQQNRPSPSRSGGDDSWQGWIPAVADVTRLKNLFDRELVTRTDTFETLAHAFDGDAQKKFRSTPAVLVDQEKWKTYFNLALALSAGGQVKIGDYLLDDAYHLPSAPSADPLRSNWYVGELTHAHFQFDYVKAHPQNDILAEYIIWYGGHDKRRPERRKQPTDYRGLSEDQDPFASAAQYAFGKYRPDLIDFGTASVYEIKPIRGAAAGVLQLWRYTHNFNCARRFDELVAQEKEAKLTGGKQQSNVSHFELAPGKVPNVLLPIELTGYVDAYMEKKRGVKKSATWGHFHKERQQGNEIWVMPITVAAIPGLILYSIHPYRPDKNMEQVKKDIKDVVVKGLIVVGVITFAALVMTVLVEAVVGELATLALTEGSSALEAAQAVVTVSAESNAVVIDKLPEAMSQIAEQLQPLRQVITSQ